jgi:hypothetical protein
MQEQTARVIDFNPKDGKQPQWKYIYDVIKDREYGEEFSYVQLESMTGLQPHVIQGLKKKVDRELKKEHKKMLVNIRGFGYKVADPAEQMNAAKGHNGKARRQNDWAEELTKNMDTSKMTLEEKNNLKDLSDKFAIQNRMLRKRSVRGLELAQENTKQSKKIVNHEKKTIEELDGMLEQINALKSKLNE